MKIMKRAIGITMLLVILIPYFGIIPVNASNVEREDVVKVKEVIYNFFTIYYSGLGNINEDYTDAASHMEDVFIRNNSTAQYLTYYKWDKAFIDEFDLNYQNCILDIDYTKINIQSDVAVVELLFGMTYNYPFALDIESKIANVPYVFTLSRNGSQWKISSIESDLHDYTAFVQELNTYCETVAAKSSPFNNRENTQAITSSDQQILDAFLALKLDDIDTMKNQSIESVAASADLADEPILQDSADNARSVSVSYNGSNGAHYAMFYAKAKENERMFYTITGADCTNFVSQCVWASYGGFTNDYTESLNNIATRKRMDGSTWYSEVIGGTSSNNWSNVDLFYNYVTSSKTYGPRGTGINNARLWNRYPNSLGSIPVGTVIQLSNGNSNDYEHSIFVNALASTPVPDATYGYFKLVLCSAHSNDHYNRSLIEFIKGFGGSNCYMRGISFSNANFVN